MSLAVEYQTRVAFLVELLPFLRTLRVILYTNDVVPDPSLDVSQFALATFPGGSAIPLTSWRPAMLTADNRGKIVHPVVMWTTTVTTPGTLVYGYVVIDAMGRYRWAEYDPTGPVDMSLAGSTYPLTVVLGDDQGAFA